MKKKNHKAVEPRLAPEITSASNQSLQAKRKVQNPSPNNKKKKGPNILTISLFGLISLAVIGGAYWGYDQFLKPSSQEKLQNNQSSNQMSNVSQKVKETLSSEELAKQKNVKARLKRNDGDYALVAVIEGEEANARLTNALQVVGNQRQLLSNLHRELASIPKEAVNQRELIAGRINQLESRIGQNLLFLRKNYAYSLQQKYLLVPEKASLVSASSEGKRSVVHEFKKFEDYQNFQSQRDGYLRQLAEAVSELSDSESEGDANAPQDSKEILARAKETPALRSLRKVLSKDFSYDPDKDHQVQFEKAGLYVQVTQSQN